MSVAAAREALERARRSPADIDMVLVACSNMQRAYPALAVEVQEALGIDGYGFDMNVACSSATFGIQTAVAAVQKDLKRLVAYSSVNHMGFVVLGIAAAAFAAGTNDATIALNGAILQMFNHGLSAAGMFFLVGVIYERTHTRDLEKFGGLFPLVPVYGGILIFTSMASLGLPGLNGFISEFLVVRGAWPILTVYTVISMLGLLFTGAYILKGIRKVLHGPLNDHWAHGEHRLTEINTREILVMVPLRALILWIGVWPAWILDVINKAVVTLF
jgi:NADH-quinone oxidoreductase subunit M